MATPHHARCYGALAHLLRRACFAAAPQEGNELQKAFAIEEKERQRQVRLTLGRQKEELLFFFVLFV